MNPRFYICIFFHHNDTVVDAQIFKIFGHNLSILYVFLSQNLLICSSTARILLCKFFKEPFFAQKLISFEPNTSNCLYFSMFCFFRLHHATWFGNLEEMTQNLALVFSRSCCSIFFLSFNWSWMQDLVTLWNHSKLLGQNFKFQSINEVEVDLRVQMVTF